MELGGIVEERLNPTSIIAAARHIARAVATRRTRHAALRGTSSRGSGRRLAEPGGHWSAASARGRGGARLISPGIYGPSMGAGEEKSREKGAAAHGDTWPQGRAVARGDPPANPRGRRGNARRDRDERRRGLPSRRPADFSWTRARDFILRMESNFAQS